MGQYISLSILKMKKTESLEKQNSVTYNTQPERGRAQIQTQVYLTQEPTLLTWARPHCVKPCVRP